MCKHPDVACEMWNGITLCHNCHKKTHSWGKHNTYNSIGRLNTVIITIPHKFQEYNTLGNYKRVNNVTYFMISDCNNEWYEYMIALHELIEETLTRKRGISEEVITDFDLGHLDADDPGSLPDAPYFKEHMFAMSMERKMCKMLGLDWNLYDSVCSKICDTYLG